MSTVFNDTSGIGRDSPVRAFSTLSQFTSGVLAQVLNDAKNGIIWAFFAISPFMGICMVSAAYLCNVTIIPETSGNSPGEGKGALLTHGSYLLAFNGRAGQSGIADEEEQNQNCIVDELQEWAAEICMFNL
ncbi:hypothetical protein BJ170DRAFT_685810 [Xylariales sp. AK1849]|nr:hypothetical protein BJ170DRAFT_685810 [Xylariales sp. AK1849]